MPSRWVAELVKTWMVVINSSEQRLKFSMGGLEIARFPGI